jgi:hypothetical protein
MMMTQRWRERNRAVKTQQCIHPRNIWDDDVRRLMMMVMMMMMATISTQQRGDDCE